MVSKIKFSYRNKPVADFLGAVSKIQGNLETPEFSSILPTPAEVKAEFDKMKLLQDQITSGNLGLIPQRNEARANIQAMVSRQCAAINLLANGDLDLLHKSGFDLCKQPERIPLPDIVERITLTNTDNGSVEVKYGRVKNRPTYVIQVCPENGEWQTVGTTTDRKIEIRDLPVKEYVFFRIRAVNTSGSSLWSRPARILVGR